MIVTVEIQNEVSSMSNNMSNILLLLLKQMNIFIFTFFFLHIFQCEKTIKIYIIHTDDGGRDDDDHNDNRKEKEDEEQETFMLFFLYDSCLKNIGKL